MKRLKAMQARSQLPFHRLESTTKLDGLKLLGISHKHDFGLCPLRLLDEGRELARPAGSDHSFSATCGVPSERHSVERPVQSTRQLIC